MFLVVGCAVRCIRLVFFRSLIRTSDYVESTLARKNSNKFGFSLAYSYLCGMFVRYIYKNSKTKDK